MVDLAKGERTDLPDYSLEVGIDDIESLRLFAEVTGLSASPTLEEKLSPSLLAGLRESVVLEVALPAEEAGMRILSEKLSAVSLPVVLHLHDAGARPEEMEDRPPLPTAPASDRLAAFAPRKPWLERPGLLLLTDGATGKDAGAVEEPDFQFLSLILGAESGTDFETSVLPPANLPREILKMARERSRTTPLFTEQACEFDLSCLTWLGCGCPRRRRVPPIGMRATRGGGKQLAPLSPCFASRAWQSGGFRPRSPHRIGRGAARPNGLGTVSRLWIRDGVAPSGSYSEETSPSLALLQAIQRQALAPQLGKGLWAFEWMSPDVTRAQVGELTVAVNHSEFAAAPVGSLLLPPRGFVLSMGTENTTSWGVMAGVLGRRFSQPEFLRIARPDKKDAAS